MPTAILESSTMHPTSSDLILKASGVNVYYGESHILRDVDLQIPKGEMVCLIGRNGVGKTTFLKTLIGLLNQKSGSIEYESNQLLKQPPYRRARHGIGYVSQGRDIIPRLTVRENLMLGMEALPGGMGKNRHIDPFIYELFPILEEFLNRRGGDLSGGQQQQLAIARALLGKPKLLLLDEPTEGIQPSIILDIERAVQRIINETGISVLLVEQHLHFVRQSNFYYAMQRGGIVSSGPTSTLSEAVIQEFLTV
jgi:urea transport system ATP-binding protein|tara:strand:+ start:219 stop:974 length:756 start_codon:yes stop_codon:yes gene_type:complete